MVNISTSLTPKINRPRNSFRDPFFDMLEPFLNPHKALPQQRHTLGTGFIIRKDGLIITNNHVIDKADVITVSLSTSKETYTAKVIGKDHRTDTALIKINVKTKLPSVKMGQSSQLQVGEWVAAFGNPFGHTNSMSTGIISAIGREINELNKFPFLQTDASINPGNSGGPLVNTRGEVIGVNTAIDARAQGIGFAIPIDNIKAILPSLEKDGGIRRGFLGVSLLPNLTRELMLSLGLKSKEGSLIIDVISDSPAEKAGLKIYDFVIQLNGKDIKSNADLMNTVADTGADKTATLKIIRKNKTKTIQVTLGSHPQDKLPPKTSLPSYRGQKAPFELGFSVMDYHQARKEGLKIPSINEPHPIVVDVMPNSPAQKAGLYPGDIILDINQKHVYKARSVINYLKKSKTNVLRILRQNRVDLIYLSKK